MNTLDSVMQTVLALASLTAVNRLIYHDTVLMSLLYAVAVMAAFWMGRGCVRLVRWRRQVRRLTDG